MWIMKVYPAFISSLGLIVTLHMQAHAQSVTAEQKKLIGKLCGNDLECERLELKQFTTFQAQANRKRSEHAASGSEQTSPSDALKSVNTDKSIVNSSPTKDPTKPPAVVDAVDANGCHVPTQRLFIRNDSLDNFNYIQYISPSKETPSPANLQASAIGAAVSYTDNMISTSQTAAINARISYLLFGEESCRAPSIKRRNLQGVESPGDNAGLPYLYGWGFAPFVSSDGTWNHPLTTTSTTVKTTANKNASGTTSTTSLSNNTTTTTVTTTSHGTVTTTTKKTSTSAFRAGADFQLAYDTRSFLLQENYFYASPFYQTDFAGLAQIGGFDLSWQPTAYNLHLGVANTDPLYIFIWQFKGETEFSQVNNPGYTIYTKGGHAQAGETVRANLALFPLNSEYQYGQWFDAQIAGRISLIGTQQYYWDFASKQAAPYYSLILQYKLGQCVHDTKTPVGSPCEITGSSALSFEYDTGKDKDTYVKTNQFKVTLNYSY
jgi:hypothetical protein